MAKKRKAETPKPKEVMKLESSEEEEVEEEVDEEVEEEGEEEVEDGDNEGEEEEEEDEDEDEDEEEEEEEEEEESSEEESSSDEQSSEEDEDDVDENDDEATKRQKLRKLLEPLGKDQIITILKDAASTDQNILSKIIQKADSDPTYRKIFVYGLGSDATQDQLRQAFQSFGEMEDCTLTMDKNTGRAKGYGFVTYKTRSAAKKALKNPQKTIGSKMASCQLAVRGTDVNISDARNRKIFVANVVGHHITPEKLRSFFETFGEIDEGPSGFDPVTNKPRGYAFFVYKSEDGLKNALREPVKHFEGCQLKCRKDDPNFIKKNITVNNVGSNTINQKQGNPVSYVAPNLNSGGFLAQQTPGVGFIGNPSIASNFNQPSISQTGFGSSGAMGGNYGINSISPSVIGSYGFGIQAALQGLGAVRSASGAAPGSTAERGPSGAAPTGMFYPPRPGF